MFAPFPHKRVSLLLPLQDAADGAAVRGATVRAGLHVHENSHCGVGQADTRRSREFEGPAHGSLQEKGRSVTSLP